MEWLRTIAMRWPAKTSHTSWPKFKLAISPKNWRNSGSFCTGAMAQETPVLPPRQAWHRAVSVSHDLPAATSPNPKPPPGRRVKTRQAP